MIIDDSDEIRELIETLLDLEGYKVRTYSNGIDALADLKAGYKPNLLLLDWRMPLMSGKEFLEQFKTLPIGASSIAIYIFSAESDHRLYAEAGCAGMLKKPINVQELFDLVHKYS